MEQDYCFASEVYKDLRDIGFDRSGALYVLMQARQCGAHSDTMGDQKVTVTYNSRLGYGVTTDG